MANFVDHYFSVCRDVCQHAVNEVFCTISGPSENGGFAAPISTEQLRSKHEEAIPNITRQNNSWAVSVWREWAYCRNKMP